MNWRWDRGGYGLFMVHGTGYNISSPDEIYSLMQHRRRQLQALSIKARRADEAAELERELAQLDEDIAAGVAALERMEPARRQELAAGLRRHFPDASAAEPPKRVSAKRRR